MKLTFLKVISIIAGLIFFIYLVLPNPGFPNLPPNSLQSIEPADSETPLRRAYFTDYTREQVMEWYTVQFHGGYRLNHPPEEAAEIIRDQTRSTFLEEIVHPFRENIYIDGFEPTSPKDAVIIGGRLFRQKIIVRYVPSNVLVRLAVFAGTIFFTIVLINSYKATMFDMRRKKIKV